ncbi:MULTISPECIES: 4-hydroxyproline epimerase [Providencia]|uniref:4-hydroxyproline epimerase n=1 Tax=Providencia rettgeri TaxID=587 RepID=A0A3R8WCG4_PRORE|nr:MULTISPECIES: 4-hydroxyproline epimerase [Providencia]ELR5072429.1 4-hydroxyproline epimerase [Providencia stuartii]ELR5068811.1 4-hydroxyproline epimerase [Providencia rettgeri]ELR5216454.1 4-hydroxyproline epimerase [Providencia rettgeri]MBV2191074.1 4-hydroxyproline epimerase [Providencia rettgeri]UPS64765.1 4-hydroxyproline epimerase [Providencia rettgeri]
MQSQYTKIEVIDSHTAGEPTRLVIDGFPDLGQQSMAVRLDILRNSHDVWRRTTILEPRGNDILVGALLCKPQNPAATAGVIFFNNQGYLGMCGHGTIGLVASLHFLGHITYGNHLIETPVGDVTAQLHQDGSVSIQNVYSYRYRKAVRVDVPDLGTVIGDIAWGGNWFFLVEQSPVAIDFQNIKLLTEVSLKIKQALVDQSIYGKDGQEIDHIELFGSHPNANSQSFVLCPGGAYDRSPCGTGTSAKLACLAADKKLAAGEIWHQASVIGSQFQASFQQADENGIIPTIRGHAYISGKNTLLIDEQDPFRFGISVA